MSELRIGIILGSTRPGRRGEQIAQWALAHASERDDAVYELVDLADFHLPHLDEVHSPSQARYEKEHTKAWSKAINSYDGFVFVTPEYNHSTSGALKNALDFLYQEWNNKAAGFISYGAASAGTRAVEHLRLIAGELQIADVRAQVAISLIHDFEGFTTLKDVPNQEIALGTMLDQVVSWAGALRTVRAAALAEAEATAA